MPEVQYPFHLWSQGANVPEVWADCALRPLDPGHWMGTLPRALSREEAFRRASGRQEDLLFLGQPLHSPGLIAFDGDSTLLADEGIDRLAAEAGAGEEVARLTDKAMQGKLDYAESLLARVGCLVGTDSNVVSQLGLRLGLNPGAVEAVEELQALGWKVCCFSGGFEQLLSPATARLGLDRLEGNRLSMAAGRISGLELPIRTALSKAEALEKAGREFRRPAASWVAVGDGANDLEMLERSSLAIGYRPKDALLSAIDGLVGSGDLARVPLMIEAASASRTSD